MNFKELEAGRTYKMFDTELFQKVIEADNEYRSNLLTPVTNLNYHKLLKKIRKELIQAAEKHTKRQGGR